jgi:hexosaminidase
MNQSIYHVNERIFMLDCGRKYYSPDWIKRLILELEQGQMNTLYIHFAEDMGHRLESKQYPWLAGGDHTLCVRGSDIGIAEDDGKFLTQDEMREIVSFAGSHGIEIVPSLDSPGHMNYAVKKYNEHYGKDIGNYFIKNGSRHIVSGSSTVKENAALSASRGIDIANPEAVEFAKSLYREYGEFFKKLGCKKFDIGGDELLGWGALADPAYPKWQNLESWDALAKEKTNREDAVAYDLFILYINEIASLMRSLGYESVRIWNDEVYPYLYQGYECIIVPEVIEYHNTTTDGRAQWRCLCRCGEETIVDTNHLISGHTKSCGCLTSAGEEKIKQIL